MTLKQDPLHVPRDAKLVSLLLESLGISEYDPLVIHQLLELCSRHILDILQDSSLYAEHSDRKEILLDDIKLAVEGKVLNSFTSPPSKDFLLDIAEKKNSLPLPQVTEKFGLRCPPERHTLTAPNMSILPKKTSGHVQSNSFNAMNAIQAAQNSLPLTFTKSATKKVDDDDEDYDI